MVYSPLGRDIICLAPPQPLSSTPCLQQGDTLLMRISPQSPFLDKLLIPRHSSTLRYHPRYIRLLLGSEIRCGFKLVAASGMLTLICAILELYRHPSNRPDTASPPRRTTKHEFLIFAGSINGIFALIWTYFVQPE